MASEKWGAADLTSCEFEFSAPENGKPLMEDELITRLLGRIAYLKGDITKNLTRATKAGTDIAAMKSKGMTMSNLLLKGCVNSGAGHVENASSAQSSLEDSVAILIRMLAEVTVKAPELKTSCNQMIEREENSLVTYSDKLSKVMLDTMQYFEPSADNSAANSRASSPVRHETFRNMKHLLPSVLNEECTTLELKKFKRDFEAWVTESYPNGLNGARVWGTLNNRLDAAWQERMSAVEGIESAELASVWIEMDKIMMQLYPTHTRRMKFLNTKPLKGQLPSGFIHQMKELATDAEIDKLTEASLILHLTTNSLAQTDLNKAVKSVIIEELWVNANQQDLKTVLGKIKGIEADFNANGDKSTIRAVNEGEYLCRLCKKFHKKGKCEIVCRHCKKRGSHKSDNCWEKHGRDNVEEKKRGREDSKDRSGKGRGK